MKLHHAAAFVLVGWYLMAPPVNSPTLPLSAWQTLQAFDSAQSCERNARQLVAVAQKQQDTQYGRAMLGALLLSQCIASDAPRLKR
jgi:hypothetical protein